MSDKLDQRARELFENTVERAVHERAEFLDTACGEDADLRHTVDRLVSRHTETTTNITRFLEAAALSDPQARMFVKFWS